MWEEHVLALARAFLRARADVRGAAARSGVGVPADARIDESDWLRGRLAAWCATAVRRITANWSGSSMHRVTRNLMHLFERIEDVEARRAARGEALSDADREAVVVALRIFAPAARPGRAAPRRGAVGALRLRGARRLGGLAGLG